MSASESHGGGFFAIDSRIWAKVTAFGMTEACAYLVLACGTGHDNRTTAWSTNAVMRYAGIGWTRAKPAIDRLVAGGVVRNAENHTASKPSYELATYRELVEYDALKNPPAAPDYYERELLVGLQAGRQPTNKTARARAERLCDRGLLLKGAQGVYMLPDPVTEDSSDHSIWLPNTIVMGSSAGEQSPIGRVRSSGDAWALRLFVDLYTEHNLRDDGGISPLIIRQDFDRMAIGQQGPYTLWGFKPHGGSHWWTGPFAAHQDRPQVNNQSPTWTIIDLLQNMGLLSFVPHIFENGTNAAEPIHVYGVSATAEAPIEREIGDAADRAARAMALPSKLEEAEEAGFKFFCPVLRTMPNAQMIGVARLTYRPRTRRTKEWFAELHMTAPGWIETFEKLAAKGESASFQRAANYA